MRGGIEATARSFDLLKGVVEEGKATSCGYIDPVSFLEKKSFIGQNLPGEKEDPTTAPVPCGRNIFLTGDIYEGDASESG